MSSLNWYSGLMAKGKRSIKQYLKAVQLVVEVLEARAPYSTCNPELSKIVGNKKRVIVLNKSDLADDKVTASWQKVLSREGQACLVCSSKNRSGINELLQFLQSYGKEVKSSSFPSLMVVGVPNVGKSTLVNQLLGKKSAATGAKAGITKGPQWIKVPYGWYILDTPGLLPLKIKKKENIYCLATLGSLKEELIDAETLASWLIDRLSAQGVEFYFWQKKYNLPQEPRTREEVIELIGLRRGFLEKGSEVSRNKTSALIIRDFRVGKIGSFTLEYPV